MLPFLSRAACAVSKTYSGLRRNNIDCFSINWWVGRDLSLTCRGHITCSLLQSQRVGGGAEGTCGSVGVLPFAISLWAIRDTEKGRSLLLTASIGFPSPSLPLFPGASLGMPHYNDYRWSFVGRHLLLLLFVVISCLFICCFCYPFAFAARFVCAELTKS